MCFASREQGFDEVLLDVKVLVEKFGEEFLVVVVADAHHGEFKEAGHRRRHDEHLAMARVDVEHHAPRGQRFEDVAGLGFGLLPEQRCCFGREGPDRKQRDEFGLCRREQDFEDLEQKLGRRSPLREAVDPLRQFAIALSGGVVGHGNSVGRIGPGRKGRHHRSLFVIG